MVSQRVLMGLIAVLRAHLLFLLDFSELTRQAIAGIPTIASNMFSLVSHSVTMLEIGTTLQKRFFAYLAAYDKCHHESFTMTVIIWHLWMVKNIAYL